MAYTTIDDPTIYFDTLLYSGNGSNPRTLTGLNFQPDWVWLKNRTDNNGHTLADAVRGANKTLSSDGTGAEQTDKSDGHLDAFTSDGFTVGAGSGGDARVNDGSNTYVAWNWKAGTTSGISGSPSITPSAYSFSQTAGFSIISYTGNASVGATIPHGLGVAPAVIIFKNRDSSVKWAVYHHKNTSAPETDHLQLNADSATSDDDSILNDTAPGSSVITMKTSSSVNSNSVKYLAYCFSEIKGYSKHGSYQGNGNADGTFVYTGFKPAWVMTKRSNNSENWYIIDNKRSPFNPPLNALFANGDNVEDTNATGRIQDFLSNGFKLRTSDTAVNGSGSTYVYMAFAESPFVNSNGIPTNAK